MKNVARTIRDGVLGAMAGGALGLATGLLVAPKKGKKVRRRLIYQLENAALRAGVVIEELLRSSGADNGDARRTGDALVEDAEVRAKLIREDIDELLKELQQ
jgi:gas vesicle protein